METAAARCELELEALRASTPARGEGNEACDVRHVASVQVPCAACDCNDASSRLAFFELTVPNFGAAASLAARSFSFPQLSILFGKRALL